MQCVTFVSFAIACCFVSIGPFTVPAVSATKTPSGLYNDDGHGHTILTQKFSKKDVREISHDILNIMGLHHRPHPNLVDNHSPGSQFLWEIYNSIASTDEMNENGVDLRNWEQRGNDNDDGEEDNENGDNWISTKKNLTWSQFNVNREEIEAISNSDSIISFVNRGHRYSNILKGYEEDKQFWFDVSEVSEEESFVLGTELRIWKRTMVKPKQKAQPARNSHHHHHHYKSGPAVKGNELDDASSASGFLEDDSFGGDVLRIAVKQIVPDDINESFQEIELDEIVVAKWEQGWLRLNVTPAFRNWVSVPKKNFGLVLSVKTADDDREVPMKASGLTTIMEPEEHQPFLVSFLKTIGTGRANPMNAKKKNPSGTKHRRVIRSTDGNGGPSGSTNSGSNGAGGGTGGGNSGARGRGHKKSKKTARQYDFFKDSSLYKDRSCQMGMLYVNFEDLGWKDWVIAPDGFIAYYCHGECSFPLTASMNATNHAIVSTLVHTYYPLEYPRASCAPIKLGSISMLYYDDNSNVTVKKYKDMVIKSCGCK